MILSWRSWREHSLIYALFLSFLIVTAVFFGHTSHRSYLDVYWIAYSAYVLAWWIRPTPEGSASELARI
jgi:hypothetical protein